VLRAPPSGRLHRALVDTGRAVSVFGFDQQLREPGLVFFGARLAAGRPLEATRDALLDTLEGLGREPITEAEVQRARTVLLRQLEQSLATPTALGRTMSEWIANGDWRLFFIHRNRLRALTAADVNRVARDYLKRSNRTVGLFVPDPAPDRAEIPPAPDLDALLAGLAAEPALAAGEAFDPTPANIEQRTRRQRLPAGLELLMLPRATRGQLVHAQLTLRFGDERSLAGRQAEATMLAALLARGTTRLDRQQLRDEFDRMGTQLSVSGSATGVTVSLRAVREHLPASLARVVEMLRDPALPARDLEELRADALAGLDRQRQDPAALGSLAWRRHTERYPRGDPRHPASLDEQATDLKAVTRAGMLDFHRRFYGASNGQLAIVGDFDPPSLAELATRLLGEWRSASPWSRVLDLYHRIEPRRIVIETPDRANAWFRTGLTLELSTDDADYPALLLAGQMLGGGFLSSRLAERVRHREGLSYSVWARFEAGNPERSGTFTASAIFAPENAARLERAVREELERALAEGFSDAEVAAAKAGYLQSVQVARGNDARLTAALVSNADLGRTYQWQAALDARIAALTPAEVHTALRRHLDLSRLSTVLSGDFAAAAGRPESLRTAPAPSAR
jgi:zinc protease